MRGHAQRPHRVAGHSRRHPTDHLGDCLPYFGRIQLHPARLGLVEAILAVSLGQGLTVQAKCHDFAAADADIKTKEAHRHLLNRRVCSN